GPLGMARTSVLTGRAGILDHLAAPNICSIRAAYQGTDVRVKLRDRERGRDNRPMAGGVRIRVAVCLTQDDRMLLVQHEKAGRRYWLLPGGGLERGETVARCAEREVEEETGYRVAPGRLVLVCEAIEPAGRHILN